MVFKKGQIPWNKGKLGQVAWNKGKLTPNNVKQKISTSRKGKQHSIETLIKMKNHVPWNKGKFTSPEIRLKMSISRKNKPWSDVAKAGHILHGGHELPAHKKTKEDIAKTLRDIGYKVITEKFITVDNKQYAIDVYADKNKNVILIEVGRCLSKKLLDLQYRYPIVLHVPKKQT